MPKKPPRAKASDELPNQVEVYFSQFPTLELDRLAQFVDAREPGDASDIRAAGDEQANADGLRVSAFAASQGSMTIGTLVHNIATPGMDLIRHSSLHANIKKDLLAHQAYALLTLVGGADLPPVERILFLYKVATGLCFQGAIGMANVHTGHVFPGGLLRDLFGDGMSASEVTVWESLRDHGEPAELLVRFGMVELQGKRCFATIGAGHCGLPDFVWEYTNSEDAGEVSEMFRSCFTYMMENGIAIQPGHTFGYDENVAFRFEAPAKGLTLPYPSSGLLWVTKQNAS